MRWAWVVKGSTIHCFKHGNTDQMIQVILKKKKKKKLIEEIASFITIETVLLEIIVPLAWQNH